MEREVARDHRGGGGGRRGSGAVEA